MKKLSIICFIIGLILTIAGCTQEKEMKSKEVKVIFEHHVYIHNFDSNRGMKPRRGIQNPEQKRNHKFGQSKGGVDQRYDHKPGMMPPKKEAKTETK